MAKIGHHPDPSGQRSCFRVFAPERSEVAVVLLDPERRIPLAREPLGHWCGDTARLPDGTRYWIEIDGRRVPDVASLAQPDGVHGPSMIATPQRARSAGWRGIRMADAIIYELHLGTFTPEGTLAAATPRLDHLQALGVNVVELMPVAAFPGERNWGYDGVSLFALHAAYGTLADLRGFIESAHARGIAVLLDVVYNHFGPEGNYSAVFAPYTKSAETPWGAAINFDGPYNHGVREFFLENTRYWLQEIGFDGFRMDAVSLVFDLMPRHILREITDLAREIGRAEGREVLMIAEHLRNNREVTAAGGFHYHAQWNDDLNHALFAHLTGETTRHYANFGAFDDIVKAIRDGFVLDGTRLCRLYRYLVGSDASGTHGSEHVVHIQDHDQVGNRARGDRMIATYGRDKAMLAIAAVMASPFVPMLFMGEEFGEEAPFWFFEDFSEPALVEGVRRGRKAEFAFAGEEPADPHDRATFEASKLQWQRLQTPAGRRIFEDYRTLIALKRSGELGPRERERVQVEGDAATGIVRVTAPDTVTWLNFSAEPRPLASPGGMAVRWRSDAPGALDMLAGHAAVVFARSGR